MRKNIIWNTFGGLFYSLCQWFITIVVVRMATFEAAGMLSLAVVTSSSFSAIALFSMRNFQISDVDGEYTDNTYVGSRIITCTASFVLCAIASLFGNSMYQALCIDMFMLVRLAEAFTDVLHGIDQKMVRYDLIGKSLILRGGITALTFVLGLRYTNGLLPALFIVAICNVIAAWRYDWRGTNKLIRLIPDMNSRDVINLLIKCFPLVVFYFLLSLENVIPKNVLQMLYGSGKLGIYATIATPTLAVQVFAAAFFTPFLPKFSDALAFGRNDEFIHMLHKMYFIMMVSSGVIILSGYSMGRFFLKLLFGEYILNYYDLFIPIVIVTILTAIVWITAALLIAIRQIKLLLIGIVVDFIVCILITIPLIRQFNMNGVSVVQIIAYGILALYMMIVCEITVKNDHIV